MIAMLTYAVEPMNQRMKSAILTDCKTVNLKVK